MKYWIDTEFIERPYTIDLISVGLVAEDGREFYAESNEVDWSKRAPCATRRFLCPRVRRNHPHELHAREKKGGELHVWPRGNRPIDSFGGIIATDAARDKSGRLQLHGRRIQAGRNPVSLTSRRSATGRSHRRHRAIVSI